MRGGLDIVEILGGGREALPVVAGEVTGWRAWIVVTRGVREPRLRSLFHDVIWPTDRWLVAEARKEPATGYVELHGICAARDREHLASLHRFGSSAHPRYVEGSDLYEGTAAIGEVGLAGLIVPGERGYRAEKARVISILLPYIAWELVEPLRRAYRVPVGLDNVLVNAPGGHRGHRA
jgi:hypothetical protein